MSRLGFVILRQRYDQPIPDDCDFAESFWSEGSAMVGVTVNEQFAVGLLERVFPPLLAEFRASVPVDRPAGAREGSWLMNGSFMAVGTHVY